MSLRPLIEAVVAGVRPITPRVTEISLHTRDGRAFPMWDAGAHIEVHAANDMGGPLVRHYSLLGATGGDAAQDDPDSCWRIAIQRGLPGGGAERLQQQLVPGQTLRVSTPQNLFSLDRRDPFSLLVAGGIGVTPIHAMTRSLMRRRRPFAVFYVGRHAADMPYRAELDTLAGARLQCHATGEAGRPDLQSLLRQQPAGTRVYCCGPVGLIQAVEHAAAALAWSPDRVRSERFGAAAQQLADQAFDVTLRHSRQTLRVPAGQSILDVLCAARIDVLADCRRGECGLCAQNVVQTDGPLEHRDSCLNESERAEGRSLCICVSRTRGKTLELDL
jgi:ferredoxin-NADP reductase